MSTDPVTSPEPAAQSHGSREKTDPKRTAVVRDSTFVRAVADDVAVLPLGRDIELACLHYGGQINALDETAEHYSVVGDDSITEVARIRLYFPQAVTLAMRILQYGVEANRVKRDAVVTSIQQWTADKVDEAEGSDE